MKTSHLSIQSIALLLCIALMSCTEFVRIDPPRTDLIRATVFESDATAKAAVTDLYYQMSTNGFASGNALSVTFLTSLSSDEQINYAVSNPEYQQFNDNVLQPNNSFVLRLWSDSYQCIYKTNAVLEGLQASPGITQPVRNQLEGEARAIRAFCHFYLVNMFGDVPLVLTTDYQKNSSVSRSPIADVYFQIVQDLKQAEDLLLEDYSASANERVRINKWAVRALLARVNLYIGNWADAETYSSLVISKTGLYKLSGNLDSVFIKNSPEAIWQFHASYYPNDLLTFYIFDIPSYGALRDSFVNSFDVTDRRRASWIGNIDTHFFSMKYKSFDPQAEYSTVLRLAEQYLIRAEALANQEKAVAAQNDLNIVRLRAGLGKTAANDKVSLLSAIRQERQKELFTEWGHRWFDLKRTNQADDALHSIKPLWTTTAALFPIPELQILNDNLMKGAQNPGY
jgi:hypothetical protein